MYKPIERLSSLETPEIRRSIQRMVCTGCGAEANASCNCGVAYQPKSIRVVEAVKANPEKSDRAIAAEIGVGKDTVRRARETTGACAPVEERTGLDGKTRKMPEKKSAPVDDDARKDHYAAADPQEEARKAKPATKVPQAWREKAAAQGYDFAEGPKGSLYMVPAKDTALESFDAAALELIRLIKGQEQQRFAKTAVPLPLLGDLAHYLRELVAVRKPTDDAATP